MDCKTALQLAPYLHRSAEEIDSATQQLVIHHLKNCATCALQMAPMQAFDRKIHDLILDIPTPIAAKTLLLTRLTQIRRRRITRQLALAASLAGIITCSFWLWPRDYRIQVDLESFVIAQTQSDRRYEVESWLAQHGLTFQPTTPIMYERIVSFGMTELHGKDVPMFYLWHPEQQIHARIYILRKKQFDFTQLANHQLYDPTSNMFVKFIEDAIDPNSQGYLMITNGDSITPFLDFRNFS